MGSLTPNISESRLSAQERSFQTLYAEGKEDGDLNITNVFALPTSTFQLSSNLPLASQYPYQYLASDLDTHTMARVWLSMVGQMTGMMSGKMPLVLFDLDNNLCAQDGAHQHRVDALRTFSALRPEDRPEVTFVEKPEDIQIPAGGKIAVFNPTDCLVHLPHTADPDVHYNLLSKTVLARSGLPTPSSQVIGTTLEPSQVHDADVVAREAKRMLEPLHERPLPFVAKLPQALLSTGTFVVRSEEARQRALDALGPELRRMVAALTPANAHLRPASLVLQEVVQGTCVALSLFVTRAGRVEFLSCVEQLFAEGTDLWTGARVSYPDQDRLQREYAATAAALGAYLHERGYYGPVGIDIMTDAEGHQMIIDMNVRLTGSMSLGFWRHHFVTRGFLHASLLFPVVTELTRDGFEEHFSKEMRDGQIVILGWSHDNKGGSSLATMMLGSETPEGLHELITRVKAI